MNITCSALPEALLESELFGHERGAFTGADRQKRGLLETADGGTVFLDEIGEMVPALQAKLLRFLEEKTFRRVGGSVDIHVDVRVVAATNRKLDEEVRAGRFREDLFYRLHVFPILIPPLRQRLEDIPELTRHFLTRIAAEEGKRMRGVDAPALALLSAFRWPGNVRQLENAIFRAVVLADGEEIGVNEFPQIVALAGTEAGSAQQWIEPSPAMAAGWPDAGEHSGKHSDMSARNAAALTMASPTLTLVDPHGDVRPLEDIEREVIRFAIAHYEQQMSEVARRLKIGRSTLYRKLDGLGLTEAAPAETTPETEGV
jgi:DNA-binding NtrC family response regulator